MTDDTEVRLGHLNLIAYSRAVTQWSSRGSIHEDGGTLLFAGGSWIPAVGNGAFRTDDAVSPAALITQADAFFARRKRGYSVKVRDTGQDADLQAACEEAGLVIFGEPVPQMICRARLEALDPPEGITLRAVRDAAGVTDFTTVNRAAYATYGMPDDVFTDIFDRPERLLADPQARVVVAYQGSQPVATALTYVNGGVASLQWVGTVPDARHMNLGRIVTVWATNAGFDTGATSVTLQASPMGAPLYAKLGYQTMYHYHEYARWNAVAP
jgi:Acetyltransferase (GNAT) domain